MLHDSKKCLRALERDRLTSREANLKRIACKALTESVSLLDYAEREVCSGRANEPFISPFCESSVRLSHHGGRSLGPVTYLPHKNKGIPLSTLPKDQQASLPACSPDYLFCAQRRTGNLELYILKIFWYDTTRKKNARSLGFKVDAVTTMLSRRVELCYTLFS